MAERQKPKQKPTPYVVLEFKMIDKTGSGTYGWVEVGQEAATIGEKAIKAHANSGGAWGAGQYKAVPLASWESNGNNLVIENEQKLVTNFSKPVKQNKAKAST